MVIPSNIQLALDNRKVILAPVVSRFFAIDLEDLWQDLLLRAMRIKRPLTVGCLRIAAANLAIDQLRKRRTAARDRASRKKTTMLDAGRITAGKESVDEVLRTIRCLPSMQRLVMTAFVLHWPESRKLRRLTEIVRETSGIETNYAAVRRTFHIARDKIREKLGKGGAGPTGFCLSPMPDPPFPFQSRGL